MRNLIREIGSKAFVASGQETINLPRDYAYIDLMVELYAIVTITAANGAEVIADNAPAQLIKQLEVRANGRDVIKSLDFAGLIRLTQIRYGTAPNNTVLATGANQATTCYVYAIIPQAMWRAVKPFDTVFNARPLSTYEMIVTFGAITDILVTQGAGGASMTATGTFYVSSKESVGIPDDQLFPINKEATIESTVTATATEHKISLNYAKDLAYRALVLRSLDGGAVSNAIINNIKLQSGGVIFHSLAGRRVRNRNKLIYSLETMPTGYYAIEFCDDGRLGDSLDTSGLSSLDLILDVTVGQGTTKVKVYTTELITPTKVS